MERIPDNRAELCDLLEAAVAAHRPPTGPVNEEHLALLAAGRLDLLSDAERETVLRQVAVTPWAAQLVEECQDLGLGLADSRRPLLDEADSAPDARDFANPLRIHAESTTTETPAQAAARPRRRPQTGSQTFRLATRTLWALAASLTLALGVWRIADPPQPETKGGFGTFGVGDAGTTGTPAMRASDQVRDNVLVIVGLACLLLSIPVTYWALRGDTPTEEA